MSNRQQATILTKFNWFTGLVFYQLELGNRLQWISDENFQDTMCEIPAILSQFQYVRLCTLLGFTDLASFWQYDSIYITLASSRHTETSLGILQQVETGPHFAGHFLLFSDMEKTFNLLSWINSLPPGRFQFNFRWVIFKLTLVNGGWGISYEIALRWMPQDLTDDKSILFQVMAWCRQATSHYLSQCWQIFTDHYWLLHYECYRQSVL